MKRQIADFLGELAEELGWEPEFEQPRVKEARAEPPLTPGRPESSDGQRLMTPTGSLHSEMRRLRSMINHLGSEVIQLRAQMAKMRNLPMPPDASQPAPADIRPWPGQLVANQRSTEMPGARTTDEMPAEPEGLSPRVAPDLTPESSLARADDARLDATEPPADPIEPVVDSTPVRPQAPRGDHEDESALELFRSEPHSSS